MTEARRMHGVLLAILSVAACADVDDVADDAARIAQRQAPGALDGGVASSAAEGVAPDRDEPVDAGHPSSDPVHTVRDPRGAYIADVRANGTGCPAGSWSATISPDGRSLKTNFSSFLVEVDRTRAIAIQDCNLAITIHAAEPVSFGIEDFHFGGYVYLEQDVQLRARSSLFVAGSPARAEWVSALVGPQDGSFRVQPTAEPSPFFWGCGTEQTLHVQLDARLLNSEPRRNGYVNITLPREAYASFKLAWKGCK